MTTGPAVLSLSLEELTQRARELKQFGRRAILGITGSPGAGKSTLAEALVQRVPGSIAVGMDGFHLAQSELVRLGRLHRKGAPDTFDVSGYTALLARLRADVEPIIYAPEFRRELEEPIAGSIAIDRAISLVITEGNYLLLDQDGWPQVRAQLDAVWHLDLDDDVRLRRLIQRHLRFGRDEATATAWATGSDERNAVAVQSVCRSADLIIRLTDP